MNFVKIMDELNLTYAEKSIGLHSEHVIKRTLIFRTEQVLSRMRWKLWHIRNPTNNESKEKFGFRTTDSPPVMDELIRFEEDVLNLMKNVKFKPASNQLNKKIRRDLNEIRSKQKILVKGDKSRRIFQVAKEDYVKDMTDEITKKYRKANPQLICEVNREAARLTSKLELDDRIDALPEGEAFFTFKDHKNNFPERRELRLLNPSKSNVGKISKKILDRVNTDLRNKTGFNQWKSTNDCLKWFNALEDKEGFRCSKLDIQSFYPEIGRQLLENSISWARQITQITDDEIELIFHCRRSFLFFDEEVFVKKDNADFSVEQGGLDSAEVSELVGLYILHKVTSVLPKEHVGIFRDDMLFLMKATRRGPGRSCELMGQRLSRLFNEWFNLRITWEANLQIVNYLDISLNFRDGSYRPYRKDDSVPVYIHKDSNHPPHIKKGLVKMISRRISDLSSSEEIFNQAAPIYNQALRNSGFDEAIKFSRKENNNKRTRGRKIIYFHPPWSDQIESKLGKGFLQLLDKHFPRGCELFHYFNRQKVKVSYSNLPNVARQIKGINRKVLHPEKILQLKGCNCPNGPDNCVVEGGHCLTDNVVYCGQLNYEQEHPITRVKENVRKDYFGLTSNQFKIRFSSHKSSIKLPAYKTQTRLSRHVWKLKEANPPVPFQLKFSIVKLAQSYTKESKFCFLCQAEKTFIAYSEHFSTLNQRSEILNKCRHRRKFLLMNWK